ncbi:hypothetical protein [Streptomyces sp. NPDC001401]|uniref:hypothetical protein n=1 Tax=Streptomyces sp. NPDC001401 TaxID=3364570 RepID=UPI003699FC96
MTTVSPDWRREAEFQNCGRTVRVHVPWDCDGNELHTYWHKHGRDRDRWCRSFVDLLDTRRVAAGPAARA